MLRKFSIRLGSILAAILLAAASVFAQGVHTLQGRVITPNGTSTSRAREDHSDAERQANLRNVYRSQWPLLFPALARGNYQLTAQGDNQTFETTNVYAEVAAYGSAPQLFTQDIQLRAIAGKPLGQTGVVNAFTQNVPRAARQALERAAKLNEEKKTDAAVEQLMEAVRIFPAYLDAHLELGNIFLKTGRLDQAIAELDRAREIDPNDERAYQSFGLVLMKLKNYPVAVAIFAEAARLNPNNPTNALMHATAQIHQAAAIPAAQAADRQGLLDGAALSLAQAAKLSDDKVKADSLTLATFYEMKGEPERAATELELFLRKVDGKNAEAIQKEITRLRAKAKDTKPLTQ